MGDLSYVVAATPRSGTGYMARLLTRIGVDCGHEQYFNTERRVRFDPARRCFGDASWLCVPFLRELPASTVILHQVRDPIRTINSMLHTKHFAPIEDPFRRFIAAHATGIREDWTQERAAMFFWRHWNGRIEEAALAGIRKYVRYRVEDLTPETMRCLVDMVSAGRPVDSSRIAAALREVPRDFNQRGAPIAWINHQNLCPLVRDLAIRYGYDY